MKSFIFVLLFEDWLLKVNGDDILGARSFYTFVASSIVPAFAVPLRRFQESINPQL